MITLNEQDLKKISAAYSGKGCTQKERETLTAHARTLKDNPEHPDFNWANAWLNHYDPQNKA